jgi:hypothetical protein
MAEVIEQVLLSLLNNPLVTGPVVVFVLSFIPGPFRGIVRSIIESLMERAKAQALNRQGKIVTEAVNAAEQMGGTGQMKKATAVKYVLDNTDLDLNTAQTKVEAAVKTMKDYEAIARAEFEEFVRSRDAK